MCLSERKTAIEGPPLRSRKGGEVAIPEYEALASDAGLRERMLELPMWEVSTCNYQGVLPAMVESAGMSKSQVSREAIEESTEQLGSLCERSLNELALLIIYLDGIQYSN